MEKDMLNLMVRREKCGKERLEWTLMLAGLGWEAQITQREDAECADERGSV